MNISSASYFFRFLWENNFLSGNCGIYPARVMANCEAISTAKLLFASSQLKKKEFLDELFYQKIQSIKHLYYTKINLKYSKISQLTVVSKCGISKQKTLPDFIEKTMFLDFSFWVIGKTQKICMWEVSDVGI